jgi:endo-1,4-beta-D-glucanase Y
MKFDCKEISMSDEEFGCTLTLSENEDKGASEIDMTNDEIMTSTGQYVLLQRNYSEDEFEPDYYYIETSNPDKSGELKNFSLDLYRTQLLMTYDNELFEISININDNEFENLKKALQKLTNKKGQLTIHD